MCTVLSCLFLRCESLPHLPAALTARELVPQAASSLGCSTGCSSLGFADVQVNIWEGVSHLRYTQPELWKAAKKVSENKASSTRYRIPNHRHLQDVEAKAK